MNALTGEVGLVRMHGYLSLTPAQTWSIDWRNEDLPSLPRICSSEHAGLPMLRASFYTCCCMGVPHRCFACATCGSLVVSDQKQIAPPTRSRMRRSVMVRSSTAKPVSWIPDSLYGQRLSSSVRNPTPRLLAGQQERDASGVVRCCPQTQKQIN